MSNAPLMPKATAVWLVDNTALTFDQLADFYQDAHLEIRAIADGDAAQGIKGMDPISTGQFTREEIETRPKTTRTTASSSAKQSRPTAAAEEEGPALHPGLAPPRAPERHPVAGPQPSRAERQPRSARLVGTTKTTIASASATVPTGMPRP